MPSRAQNPTRLLAQIRSHDFTAQSDAELRHAVQELQPKAQAAKPDDLLTQCFAIVAEAVDRRLGVWRLFDDPSQPDFSGESVPLVLQSIADVVSQRRYRRPGDILLPAAFYQAARRQDSDHRLRFQATDEQILAGIHLYRGRVVQMDAGEGKTVAIAVAAALHALAGRRVHVITANEYLAERDASLLEAVYRSLGLTSGVLLGHMEAGERRHVYGSSIVYGAMRELGFDYLRDNLKATATECVQQPLDVAIADEADHALIDEAFTPLIISGNPMGGTRSAVRVNGAIADMIALQRIQILQMVNDSEKSNGEPKDQLSLLATLSLADPGNPALLRRGAAYPRLLRQARALAEDEHDALAAGLHYAIQPEKRYVTLTDQGRAYLEHRLGPIFDLAATEHGKTSNPVQQPPVRRQQGASAERPLARRYRLANQVSQALRAHLLLQRDVDYLVDDDSVVLIDPYTGRPKPDSIYQQGLQPAVEAREGVTVRPENETLAQISVSGLVSRYRGVAGITGTAASSAGEFRRKYGLEVAIVPPLHPPKRVNQPPLIYQTRQDKLAAVVDEVAIRHRTGQPVLVGTRTVEQSEELAHLLDERGIPHQVLNAVTTHAEAGIVHNAGTFGSVTVATHMAGRGTDILLEPGLDASIAKRTFDEVQRLLTSESTDVGLVDVTCPSQEQADVIYTKLCSTSTFTINRSADSCTLSVQPKGGTGGRTERTTLHVALGLCVIGTEVHDSSRITLQLNGRSGRQGQFGITKTFLSLEDRLVNLDAEVILKLTHCQAQDAAGRACYTGPDVSRRIQQLQDAADREGEAQRALMQDFAAELDRQTHLYHQRRQQVIALAADPDGITDLCHQATRRVVSRLYARHLGGGVDDDYAPRFARLQDELRQDFSADCSELYGTGLAEMPEALTALLAQRLARQAARAGNDVFPELARLLYLQVCSELWSGHLATLRDLLAVELLSSRNHKSAVAAYFRRCQDAWQTFWESADDEFLSRLTTMLLSVPDESATAPVVASTETERLLSQGGISP